MVMVVSFLLVRHAVGVAGPVRGGSRRPPPARSARLDHRDLVRRGVADPDPPVGAAGHGVHLGALDRATRPAPPRAGVDPVDVAVVGLDHAEGAVRLVPEQPVRAGGGKGIWPSGSPVSASMWSITLAPGRVTQSVPLTPGPAFELAGRGVGVQLRALLRRRPGAARPARRAATGRRGRRPARRSAGAARPCSARSAGRGGRSSDGRTLEATQTEPAPKLVPLALRAGLAKLVSTLPVVVHQVGAVVLLVGEPQPLGDGLEAVHLRARAP